MGRDGIDEAISPGTRAKWAQRAMEAHREARGEDDSDECDAINLMADLLHFCKLNDIDTENILETARMHFEAEQEEFQDETEAEDHACRR